MKKILILLIAVAALVVVFLASIQYSHKGINGYSGKTYKFYETNNSCPPEGIVVVDDKEVYKGHLYVGYKEEGDFEEIKKIIEQEGGMVTTPSEYPDYLQKSVEFCGDWDSKRLQSLENKFKLSPGFDYIMPVSVGGPL